MKKAGKVVAIVFAVVLVLLIGLTIALPLLLDPNDYKDRVVQLVKEKTGRDLTIGGKIGLSFFPWIGVELNKLSLSNARGFGNEPFAQVEQSVVRVKLLPLLRKEVEVDKVVLKGLQLNLAKDARGKTNWADLTQGTAATDSGAADAPAPADPATSPLAALSVNGLDVRDSRLTWRDAATGSSLTFHNIKLATGALAPGKETMIELGVDIESKPKQVSTQGGAQSVPGPAPGTPLRTRLELKTRAQFDPQAQTAALADLQLALGELKLKADIKGERIMTAPAFKGTVDLAPFNLRALLAQLGTQVETSDKEVLKKAALKSQFEYGDDALTIKGLSAQLDDSTLSGTFALSGFAKPAYRFDLKLDRFDLDRYLAPTPAAPAASAPSGTPPTTAAAPVAIPVDTLRALNADGTFRIGQFKAFSIRSSDVVLKLKAHDGLMQFGPTQAKLYGGSYSGNISYDARTNNPLLTMNEELKGVQLGAFLKDTQNFDKFVGTGNVSIKTTARGMNAQAITASLNGNAGFFVQDGVLKGIDVRKMGKQIEDTAKTRRIEGLADIAPQAGDETKFQALRATMQIKDGVAFNEDLDLQGAGLKVSGKGSANLVDSSVDYVANLNGFPLKISGPFAKLKYRPDWNAILKSQLAPRVEQEKQKLREKQDKLEDDTKQKLNKKLQDYLKR